MPEKDWVARQQDRETRDGRTLSPKQLATPHVAGRLPTQNALAAPKQLAAPSLCGSPPHFAGLLTLFPLKKHLSPPTLRVVFTLCG